MYRPPHFDETRLPELHGFIRAVRLTTLVTMGEQGLEASHIPVLLKPEEGEFGTLYAHIAKANFQWRRSDPKVMGMAVFLGPEAYISPSWYPTKRETGKVVPTWNYVAVHAYGSVEFFDDRDRLLAIVTGLTELHEANRPDPWAVTDAPADYVTAQLKGIVGIRLPIARLEGKWKMSQNRTAEDRKGVIEGLGPDSRVGEMMS